MAGTTRTRRRRGRGAPKGFWATQPPALRRDVLAVVLFGLAALGGVALAPAQPHGVLGAVRLGLEALLGRVAVALPVAVAGLGVAVLFPPRAQAVPARGLGLTLLVAVLAAGFGFGAAAHPVAAAWRGPGGAVGAAVDWILQGIFGRTGAWVVLGTAGAAALLLLLQFSLAPALAWPLRLLWSLLRGMGRGVYGFVTEPVPAPAPGTDEPVALAAPTPAPVVEVVDVAAPHKPRRRRRPHSDGSEAAAASLPEAPSPSAEGDGLGSPAPAAGVPAGEMAVVPPTVPDSQDAMPDLIGRRHGHPAATQEAAAAYQPPPLDLLRRGQPQRTAASRRRDATARAAQLEEALRSFGVAARVVDVTQGPAITRYEVAPGPGVKVARIAGLADDLALALSASDVRIVAPIPGKGVVGIEVPNLDVSAVHLRDVLESTDFQHAASPLTVCLGQDIAGKPVVCSLERVLHVLVAGATGSGKSILINAMLISMLYKARPETLRLVLVDPKMVELSTYNGIPHLLAPVVTDPKKAAATLRVVVKEMERRYGLFTKEGVRNITGYNAAVATRGEAVLPFVVVVIDELADLMLVARSDVEDSIQRLTQMARAAGIHLIVATQRPSVDVITGVIKANIPTRIALAVASQVDSRTILDGSGAEKLVGRGDMLFRPMGVQKLLRAQGAFIDDAEVEAVLSFLRERGRPDYDATLLEVEEEEGGGGLDAPNEDRLFADALAVVVESGQASVSNIQRRLRVGFTRAGRLIDMMEQRGFVGPHSGSKSREVLLSVDQFRRMYGDRGGLAGGDPHG